MNYIFNKRIKKVKNKIYRFFYNFQILFPESNFWFFLKLKKPQKRLLAIYDLSIDPMSVGDVLIFQSILQVLKHEVKVSKIDLIVINDINLSLRGKLAKTGLRSENYYYYFTKILPVFYVNKNLGSLILMDSVKDGIKYIADNLERYEVFPPFTGEAGQKVSNYTQYFNYIKDYYNKHKFRPTLSVQPAIFLWANVFLSLYVRPNYPILVHLRSRPVAKERNAETDVWLEFFLYCNSRYDVSFVLIGTEEIDSRIKKCPNILVAKDYCTTVEQDLALIQASMIYLGCDSGPASFAIFSDVPYLIFRFDTLNEKLTKNQNMPWASPLQKLIWEEETIDHLISGFEKVFNQLDKKQWEERFEVLAVEAKAKLSRWSSTDESRMPVF